MSAAGKVLSEGDLIAHNGHTFRVEKMSKHRVLEVRMEEARAADHG